MAGMPASTAAATGLDALTHAMEGYITKGAWDMSDMFHLKAMNVIYHNLEKAVKYMVQKSLDYYPMLIDDANDLEKNLLMHIYYTINRIKANLENKSEKKGTLFI